MSAIYNKHLCQVHLPQKAAQFSNSTQSHPSSAPPKKRGQLELATNCLHVRPPTACTRIAGKTVRSHERSNNSWCLKFNLFHILEGMQHKFMSMPIQANPCRSEHLVSVKQSLISLLAGRCASCWTLTRAGPSIWKSLCQAGREEPLLQPLLKEESPS